LQYMKGGHEVANGLLYSFGVCTGNRRESGNRGNWRTL
jgi:hypothetical protein